MHTFEQLGHTTIRIVGKQEITLPDGTTKIGNSVGTGFFFRFVKDGKEIHALITNKHVIKNCKEGTLTFTLANADGTPNYGKAFPLNMKNFEANFVLHPDPQVDLCALNIQVVSQIAKHLKVKVFYKTVPEELLPDNELWNNLTQLDTIFMIGYPKGLIDQVNNAPISRSGTVATAPKLDYQGKKEFLIDIATYPGSSGSPIFRYKKDWHFNGKQLSNKVDLKLIGILYASPIYKLQEGKLMVEVQTLDKIELKDTDVDMPLNLGLAIKSSRINEIKDLLFRNRKNLQQNV